ncbi:MAG: flagellar protein FlaG [Chloroflexota bacterium]
MQTGSIDPTQSTNSVGSINDTNTRIGPVAPERVDLGVDRAPRTEDRDSGLEQYDRMEIHLDGVARRAYAQFMTHPDTGQVSIKIIDADTQQLIRQIPSEEVIRFAEQLQHYWELRHMNVEAR